MHAPAMAHFAHEQTHTHSHTCIHLAHMRTAGVAGAAREKKHIVAGQPETNVGGSNRSITIKIGAGCSPCRRRQDRSKTRSLARGPSSSNQGSMSRVTSHGDQHRCVGFVNSGSEATGNDSICKCDCGHRSSSHEYDCPPPPTHNSTMEFVEALPLGLFALTMLSAVSFSHRIARHRRAVGRENSHSTSSHTSTTRARFLGPARRPPARIARSCHGTLAPRREGESAGQTTALTGTTWCSGARALAEMAL